MNETARPKLFLSILVLGGILAAISAILLMSLTSVEGTLLISKYELLRALPFMALLYLIGALSVLFLFSIENRLYWFTTSFVLRILVGCIVLFIYQPDDEIHFHQLAVDQRYPLFSWSPGRGYLHIVNILYFVFGPSILLPKLLSVFCGSLLPFCVYDVVGEAYESQKARWYGFLLAIFLPPLLIFSSLGLKEILTASLLVLLLWFLVRFNKAATKITGIMACCLLLLWIRGAAWVFIGVVGIVVYLFLASQKNFDFFGGVGRALRITIGVIMVLGIWLIFSDPISHRLKDGLNPGGSYLTSFNKSQATIMQFIDKTSPMDPKNLFVLTIRGLFSPSPFRFIFDFNVSAIIETFSMTCYYILLPLALIGGLVARENAVVVSCATMTLMILVVSGGAVLVGSDPYRHKIPMVALLTILASGGITLATANPYRWIVYSCGFTFLVFSTVWASYRIIGG